MAEGERNDVNSGQVADAVDAPANEPDPYRTAKIGGAAALAILNDDADDWQQAVAPELRGHYLTTIDYVKANIDRWKTRRDLRPKIEAAAHAYKRRSMLARVSSGLTLLFGSVAGAMLEGKKADIAISGVFGAAALWVLRVLVKPSFVTVHKERATHWKALLDKLRAAFEKAQ